MGIRWTPHIERDSGIATNYRSMTRRKKHVISLLHFASSLRIVEPKTYIHIHALLCPKTSVNGNNSTQACLLTWMVSPTFQFLGYRKLQTQFTTCTTIHTSVDNLCLSGRSQPHALGMSPRSERSWRSRSRREAQFPRAGVWVVKIQPPLDAEPQMVNRGRLTATAMTPLRPQDLLAQGPCTLKRPWGLGYLGSKRRRAHMFKLCLITLLDTRYRFDLFCFLPIGTSRI